MRSARAMLSWAWTGMVAIVAVVLLISGSYLLNGFADVVSAIGFLSLSVLFTALGSLILTRQSGNRISWVLLVIGFGILLDAAVLPLLETEPARPTLLDYLAIGVSNMAWLAIFFPLFLLLFIFPTGRFLTRRWSWAAWLEAAMVTTLLLVGVFTDEVGPTNGEWLVTNPIGFISADLFEGPVGIVWSILLLALALGGLVAIVVRYRRSPIVVRTQIKWVLYAALVFAIVYAFTVVSQSWSNDTIIGISFVFSIALLPISITVAIMRYRLFDIDRIISRTLTYALVVVLLGASYIGLITLVTSLLPSQNALAVAAATLVVAALFNPVRKRIQRAVDRRFNRSGYQAQLISEEFASKLRKPLTTEELTEIWLQAVNHALQPRASGIWITPDHQ